MTTDPIWGIPDGWVSVKANHICWHDGENTFQRSHTLRDPHGKEWVIQATACSLDVYRWEIVSEELTIKPRQHLTYPTISDAMQEAHITLRDLIS